MRAEIVSIGTELLVGSILNTNAKFLSEKLAERAIDVYRQTTVGDNVGRIVESFREAAKRADILIASGGLGPTEDDVTIRAACRFLGKETVLHKPTFSYIQKRLGHRGLRMTALIKSQCYLPKEAVVFENQNGTAPGTLSEFYFGGQKKWLLVLPGPPRELEPLFKKILPELCRLAEIPSENFVIRSLRITGLIEVQVAEKVADFLRSEPPLTVGIYAKAHEVELKIMAKASSAAQAQKMAARAERVIRGRLKNYIYGVNEDSLASVVGTILRSNRKTLSVAESCTGGLLSARLTEIPGSSDYFFGGVISYHNRVKTRQLGVNESLLKKQGAVSEWVAKEMAENVRLLFGTDYGVAITGIAGPGGGSKQKPVGLVYIALAGPKKVLCIKNIFLGNRTAIRSAAATHALTLLLKETKFLKKFARK